MITALIGRRVSPQTLLSSHQHFILLLTSPLPTEKNPPDTQTPLFFFLLVDLLSLSSSYTLLVQYFFFSLLLLIAPFAKLIEGIKSAVEEEVAEVGLRIYKMHKILSSVRAVSKSKYSWFSLIFALFILDM